MQTGSITACFTATINAAWKQFWANIGKPVFKPCHAQLKLTRLDTLVFPIINFRLSRWPFSIAKAKILDRVQRRMVGVIVNISVMPEDSKESFWRRKNKVISSLIPWHCRWSAIWAKRIVCWHEHVQRNTAGACWAHKLFSFRDPQALADLRTLNYGRPDVRAASGFTSIRWYEAVHKAMEWQTTHEQL